MTFGINFMKRSTIEWGKMSPEARGLLRLAGFLTWSLAGLPLFIRTFMSATAQQSKLAALLARTDRDLAMLIANALEVGLLLAANEADLDPEGALHRRAADIYADTVMLVEKVENGRERWRLEVRLRQLQESLERRQAGQSAAARVASKLNRQRAAVGCI
jgi:hypothetical protein